MNVRASQAARRTLVLVNYGSLLLFLVAWYATLQLHGMLIWLPLVLPLFLIACIATFIPLYMKTGLWRLSHSKEETLDERQLQITHDALRSAYSIFSVICLLIILAVATLGGAAYFLIDVVLACSLIYFAHTLPASVLAWKEREV